MIVRKWHGVTPASRGDEYADYIEKTGMESSRKTAGNRGFFLLRRDRGEEAHFVTLSFWDSEEAIRRFAGLDMAKAVYFPEDEDFLFELEPEVEHWEIARGAWNEGGEP